MRKSLSVFLTLAIITLTTACFADTASKFKGGIKDVILSPLQVTDNVKIETKDAKFLPFALVGGVLKGTFYMAKKMVTGTINVVTAPLDMIHK